MRLRLHFLAAYAAVNPERTCSSPRQPFLAAYAAVNGANGRRTGRTNFLAAYAAVNCRNCILIHSKSISWVVFFVFTNEIIRFRK